MGIPRENASSNWYEDNNEIGMVLEFKTVDSNYFTFLISHFLFVTFFSLIFGGLRVRVNVTTLPLQSHVTCHREKCRRFWKDDVIQHILTLRQTHGHLE